MASQFPERVYSYVPLVEPDSIRLLQLKPSPDQDAQVQCSLIPTTILHARKDIIDHYTALSYVWGDASSTATLLVDEIPFHVTQNLDCALKHLRDETRWSYVWADAICINQGDNEEKNQQVSLMGEIYRAAHHTVIFLGTSDPNTEMILSASVENLYKQDNPFAAEPVAKDVMALLERPWFYRVWIFQELVLSRDPRVQCGKFRCSWDEFFAMTKDVGKAERDLLEVMQSARDSHTISKTGRSLYRIPEEGESLLQLFQVLNSRRGFGVTDARDMVYAHLGLFTQTGLEVDYRHSTARAFERLVEVYDRKHPGLGILDYLEDVDLDERHPGLASWAPDWTSKHQPPIPFSPKARPANAKLAITSWQNNSQGAYRFFTSPSLICSIAYTIASIAKLSTTMHNINVPEFDGEPNKWFEQRYAWWVSQFGSSDRQVLPTLSSRASHSDTTALHKQFSAYKRNPNAARTGKRWPYVIDELVLKQSSATGGIIDDRKVAVLELPGADIPRYRAATSEQKMTGQLALVPASTAPGDYICLITGCAMACVVRDMDDIGDPEVDSIIRNELKEPAGSDRKVRHVRMVGPCFVDHLFEDVRLFEDTKERSEILGGLEDEALLAIH